MRHSPRGALAVSFVALTATMIAAAATEAIAPQSLTAGGFTVADASALAFSRIAPVIAPEQLEWVSSGRRMFAELWGLPNEVIGVWGLGPTFNEDRCNACHVNNGRSRGPIHGQEATQGYIVRLSVRGESEHGGPAPHPAYGEQLQNRASTKQIPPEGKAIVVYQDREVAFADGEKLTLRAPKITFKDLQFGELDDAVQVSGRVAPALPGLGLLEAIPEKTILALVEEQKTRGVSGKPNYVWNVEEKRASLGRFGWKANQPNLRQQTAAAFLQDIGATSALFPVENCPAVQAACIAGPTAGNCTATDSCQGANPWEVLPSRLNNITLYLQALAVPARRNVQHAAVQRGEKLFDQANCSACHVPELRTGEEAAVTGAANLVIHPYTDLLLHDMGPELADGRPDFRASGSEWRTPPLWGIGLLPTVSGHGDLLHDGRARNVAEAILWHGGEAEAAREAFKSMAKDERQALVKFVESL